MYDICRYAVKLPPIVHVQRKIQRKKRRTKRRFKKAIAIVEEAVIQKQVPSGFSSAEPSQDSLVYSFAATKIQSIIRSKILARKLKRREMFRLAKKSGVLLACEGTVQGHSGWYQRHESSTPMMYQVDGRGKWSLIM